MPQDPGPAITTDLLELSDSEIELVELEGQDASGAAYRDTMPGGPQARQRHPARVNLSPAAPLTITGPPTEDRYSNGGIVAQVPRSRWSRLWAVALSGWIGVGVGVAGTWLVLDASKEVRAATPPPSPKAAAPKAAPADPLEKAARGEPKALEQLLEKPETERSVAEMVAIARGEAAQSRLRLAELDGQLTRHPALATEPKVVSELVQLAHDKRVTFEALGVIARLPGEPSAEILYQIWVGNRARTPTTALAEKLVHSDEVRAKASPALEVALRLRESKDDCQETAAILPDATEHGDARSATLLARIKQKKTGCGTSGADDCYACLRDGAALDAALDASKARGIRGT